MSRRAHAVFSVSRHDKSNGRTLRLKRHFAANDPQVNKIKQMCSELLGSSGWSLKEENTSPVSAAKRIVWVVSKRFRNAEEAVAAGNALTSILQPRPRVQGHKLSQEWVVTSPGGEVFRVNNLLFWCRENEDKLRPFELPGPLTQAHMPLAERVYAGLRDPRQRFWRNWTAVKLGGGMSLASRLLKMILAAGESLPWTGEAILPNSGGQSVTICVK